jgi:hypothetical protein
MKQIIRKLALAVNEVLNQTELANEMDALIDYGEWSGSEPNFSKLVRDWKLDRPTLLEYCKVAESYADQFDQRFPISKIKYQPWGSYNDHNGWFNITQMLHCIFMSGELQN